MVDEVQPQLSQELHLQDQLTIRNLQGGEAARCCQSKTKVEKSRFANKMWCKRGV